MNVLAINLQAYSDARMRDALLATRKSKDPIELLVQVGDPCKIFKIDYHDCPDIHGWSV